MIAALDRGEVRVAEKRDGEWVVNEDVKAAILDYFRLRKMEPQEVGPFEYHDKIPLKHNYEELGVRVVPPAVARYGAYLAPGGSSTPPMPTPPARCTSAPICAPEPTVAHVSTIVRGPTHAPMLT